MGSVPGGLVHTRPQGDLLVICPYCDANDDKVIDSRASEAGRVIRRRRQCIKCDRRFTTYERVEQAARLVVIKRDGSRVPFRRDNVMRGIAAACGKRPIPEQLKRAIVETVEDELTREFDREVPSIEIGRRVMRELRELDEVAYIRFASEHHQFRNLADIINEINEINDHPTPGRNQQDLFNK